MKFVIFAMLIAGCSERPIELKGTALAQLPIVQESEPNDRPEIANDISEPSEIYGTLGDGDRDCYKTDLTLVVVDGAVALTHSAGVVCLDGVGDYHLTAK